jgi:hypothetical protein
MKTYFILAAKTFFIFSVFLFSCRGTGTNKKETNKDSGQKVPGFFTDSFAIVNKINNDKKQQAGLYYCESPESAGTPDSLARHLIGKVIPALDDSILLKFVYGGFIHRDKVCVFNCGPQLINENDSIYMEVKQRFGNDSVQVIYLVGEAAITGRMHDDYNVTGLLFNKTKNGWKLKDAYINTLIIDYQPAELIGVFDGRFLFKYPTFGVYAGGVEFGSDEYVYLKPNTLHGPAISFIAAASNTASEQCLSFENDTSYHCNCYERNGEVEFTFNESWKCFVFDYKFKNREGDCEMKKPVIETADQRWYMNADTAFMADGNEITYWGDELLGKINLSKEEIKKRLNVDK